MEEDYGMITKETIAEEILKECFNPNTSDMATCDVRTLLIRTAATAIAGIESLENRFTDTFTEDES